MKHLCSILLIGLLFMQSSCRCPLTVVDIDGNKYDTVRIGTQTWMVQNLRVTRYRNGDAIPNLIAPGDWASAQSGARCLFEDSLGLDSAYGLLYNWYAINDKRNIAPCGWRIPTLADFDTLVSFLNIHSTDTIDVLKEVGYKHWLEPLPESPYKSSNQSGFTALPGSYRDQSGSYQAMGSGGNWWSTDSNSYWSISHIQPNPYKSPGPVKNYGVSIRCIKIVK
jgi:uncharacterized protein (TIGR02145 family)